MAGLGTATLFIGTTQALGQDQSKRLLAFSSIGQVGYILLRSTFVNGVLGRNVWRGRVRPARALRA